MHGRVTSKRLHLKHGCDEYDHIRGTGFENMTGHPADLLAKGLTKYIVPGHRTNLVD